MRKLERDQAGVLSGPVGHNQSFGLFSKISSLKGYNDNLEPVRLALSF